MFFVTFNLIGNSMVVLFIWLTLFWKNLQLFLFLLCHFCYLEHPSLAIDIIRVYFGTMTLSIIFLENFTVNSLFFLLFCVFTGVLYHRWKKYAESEQSYRQALKINPNAQQTIENFNMLLRKMNKPTL